MLKRFIYWIKGITMPERGCSGCCINCGHFDKCRVEMEYIYGR